MESFPVGSNPSLRSLPPGTLAAACSGDLFRMRTRLPARPRSGVRECKASADSESRASSSGAQLLGDEVGFSVYEVDPPIPLALSATEKAAMAPRRARLVRCNAATASLSGYSSVDALEGASLGELLGRSDHEAQDYFRSFFEHDLVHEGLIQEQDRCGRIRVFATRSVGIDRDGLLFEVIATKTRIATSGARGATRVTPKLGALRSPAPRVETGLAGAVRSLRRSDVALLLDDVHSELAHRRHALDEYQRHGLGPHLLPRRRPRTASLATHDPQELFARVQTTVLCVLESLVRGRAASARSPLGADTPFAGRPVEACEFASVMDALDHASPGAAERLLAETLLHWKAKEELERRQASTCSLAWSLGPRTLRSALRALVGDPGLGCMWQILRRSELH